MRQLMCIHNQSETHWYGNKPYQTTKNGIFEVLWQENQINLLVMTWKFGSCTVKYYWILADTKEIAESFFSATCEWNSEIRDEILVFESGLWSKDPKLLKSIKTATFDNLILSGTLKQVILNDLTNFFASRELYKTYGIPWRRGILLIGPPGNGKTHTLKAVVNQTQKSCLYVRSFSSSTYYSNTEDNIRAVFQQARQSASCILVIEDLDSVVNQDNRLFFLNTLDGFTASQGILLLATTNYPERIDPALTKRAGRFDRKYYFSLPAETERVAFIKLWNDQLNSSMRLSDAAIAQVAELTDGFSFAYFKELFMSSMMQ